MTICWHLLPDAETVAREAARRILAAADEAIAAHGVFRLVLAGGNTPRRCYRRLARAQADWRNWEIFFGDERCLPVGHPERNSTMAEQAWLGRVPIPTTRIHVIPVQQGAQQAARCYAPRVVAALPFDLVLLGLGQDGHTASLFPGRFHSPDELVHAVHDAPKPPPNRVSLGANALSHSRQVVILISGPAKRSAVRRWLGGDDLPITHIQPSGRLHVLLDTAAAAF
jgi:6-phosphogluconolactonase